MAAAVKRAKLARNLKQQGQNGGGNGRPPMITEMLRQEEEEMERLNSSSCQGA